MDARRAVAIEIADVTRFTRWNAAAVDERDYLTATGATGNIEALDAQTGERRLIASVDVWVERAIGPELGAVLRVVAAPDAPWRCELYVHAPRRVYADFLEAATDAAGRLEFSCRLPVTSGLVVIPGGARSVKFALEDVVLGVTRRIALERQAGREAGESGGKSRPKASTQSPQLAAIARELASATEPAEREALLAEIDATFAVPGLTGPGLPTDDGDEAAVSITDETSFARWTHLDDPVALADAGASRLPDEALLESLASRYCADPRLRSPTLEWMLVDALVAIATSRTVCALPARRRSQAAALRDAGAPPARTINLVKAAFMEAALLATTGYAALLLSAPDLTLFWIIFLGVNGVRWVRPRLLRRDGEEARIALARDMCGAYARLASSAFHPGQIRNLLQAVEARGACVSAWVHHVLDKRSSGTLSPLAG